MRVIRVFPRLTRATPIDELVVINRNPTFFDEADEIHISVTFDNDIEKAEKLYKSWKFIGETKIGGPAFNDAGEFIPGMYLKEGYVITSRGCPNHCYFCKVPYREGEIRELEIKDGYNLADNNILACSDAHVEKVFNMLSRQKERIIFSGGLEAKLLKEWHVAWLKKLRLTAVWFAYDEPNDLEPLVEAGKLLRKYRLFTRSHTMMCYVLIGYKGDTTEKAAERCRTVIKLGFFPQTMLYDEGNHVKDLGLWKKFHRVWANKFIVGTEFRKWNSY